LQASFLACKRGSSFLLTLFQLHVARPPVPKYGLHLLFVLAALFSFFLAVLEFELGGLCLLGAIPPALFNDGYF
jgi:hypothetical protein